MIRSMTAFARRELQADWGSLVWELRSVNHRYLEIAPRLPEDLRVLEPRVRERVGSHLKRGKVDCTLRYRPLPGAGRVGVSLNEPLAEQLAALTGELRARVDNPGPTDVVRLMQWPGLVEEQAGDLDETARQAEALLEEALAELVATREREGASLDAAIRERIEAIEAHTAGVRGRADEVRRALGERLQQRVAELTDKLDPERLEQEVVLAAQKADVDEELDRLDAHCQEMRRVLERDEAVGRRLDFLTQELNREANTLGSKAADATTAQAAVELKVLVEQIREQVQNVE